MVSQTVAMTDLGLALAAACNNRQAPLHDGQNTLDLPPTNRNSFTHSAQYMWLHCVQA